MCFFIHSHDRHKRHARNRKYPLSLNHFYPISSFEFKHTGLYRHEIFDTRTSDSYLYEEFCVIRLKCIVLLVSMPIFYTTKIILDVIDIISALYDLIVHTAFDTAVESEEACRNQDALLQDGVDLIKQIAHLILTPVYIVLLEMAALYGLVSPYNGRKLFASIERFNCGAAVAAPCFQPTWFGHKISEPEAEIKRDLCSILSF
ncbi:MAG: hypothetical protein P1U36_08655 [Legionellaceae bacterium]|nr:hypothetical protein [Legionellaceae bacterium]